MFSQKQQTGHLGEDLACAYLLKKHYKIIERNFRRPWGELDIIAITPDKTLVFIEVKAIYQSGDFSDINSEEQMTNAKIRKFKKAAALFAGKHQELINDEKGWRLDVIGITLSENVKAALLRKEELTNILKNVVINHYENIA